MGAGGGQINVAPERTMMSNTLRPPAVAGLFYPENPAELRAWVRAALAEAPAHPPARYLIAPHAGWIYSGEVAAAAYRCIPPGIRRVLLMGPVHRVWTPGLALPTVDAFLTPLGPIPLDRAAIDVLAELPGVALDDLPHRDEHCIEVHLPFLQAVIGDFTLIPAVVGGASPAMVANVIEACDDGRTLILVSSDLSHYHDYDTAKRLDAQTARHILSLDDHLVGEQACGAAAINGLLYYAKRHGLGAELLDLRNSGDTAGTRDRVVGYGSFALRPAA